MHKNDQTFRPPWTILKILQWTVGYFESFQIENPRACAEILLAETLGCQRIDLYLRYDQPLDKNELTNFRNLIKRRINREPVAYIIGRKEFWSLEFLVDPAVLIPRPETELLVETALDCLSAGDGAQPPSILELGTGSGAVIVALAHERPNAHCWACDRSLRALLAARTNARRNGCEAIHFFASDWFQAIMPKDAGFDLILSNPPYISTSHMETLAPEIRLFEPAEALEAGPEGLRDISRLMKSAPNYLKPGGRLMLEIGFDQHVKVEGLARQCESYDEIRFEKDFGGHYRVVNLRRRSSGSG